jgi:hypothetical protein
MKKKKVKAVGEVIVCHCDNDTEYVNRPAECRFAEYTCGLNG